MTIPYTCPECGHHGNAAGELAGKQGTCPRCKTKILVDSIEWAVEAPPAGVPQREDASGSSAEQLFQLINESAERRDKLLTLIAERLWWISLWTFLLFLIFFVGCPVIIAN